MKTAIGIAIAGIVALVALVGIATISCAEGKPSGVPCKSKKEPGESSEIKQNSVTKKIADMCLKSNPGSVACGK